MSKRRGFRGSDEDHARQARSKLLAMRRAAESSLRDARAGDCAGALTWFRKAAELEGKLETHLQYAPRSLLDTTGAARTLLNQAERALRHCRR